MTLDDLLARESIRDLVVRYNSYGDSGRFEQLWPLFADDAVMEIRSVDGTIEVHEGLAAIQVIFTGAQQRVPGGEDGTAGYLRHSTATHQIDLVDADHATGRCYFSVIMGTSAGGGLDHWGRYVDRYVRRDGRWQFARRTVIVDGSAADSTFAAPTPS